MPDQLFKEASNIFRWKDVKTFMIRSQYNQMLRLVLEEYLVNQYPALPRPNFLNRNYCLTLEPCNDLGNCANIFQDVLLKQEPVSEDLLKLRRAKIEHENALLQLTIAKNQQQLDANQAADNGLKSAEKAITTTKANLDKAQNALSAIAVNICFDAETDYFCMPSFIYQRKLSLPEIPASNNLNMDFATSGLTVGAVLWMYFYERMGIFKILGALLDDYNYRGKFTISGNRKDKNDNPNNYSVLIDMISSLHRMGICSNLRDRICTYQRVLGVTIENNLGIDSEKNTGFMETFNQLIDYQLEYYRTKQLAQAIQAQSSTSPQPRSSVATQTSIRDTINVLKQQFEPMQYGRNQINTFLGISVIHATICLVNMLKTEIGIPDQYEKPEEFIPAAYDILVAKRPLTLNQTNRFIVYDNCASYGYRLLTDLETLDINLLSVIATGSTLDLWLNDIEGLVEGYRNAYKAVPEGVQSIV